MPPPPGRLDPSPASDPDSGVEAGNPTSGRSDGPESAAVSAEFEAVPVADAGPAACPICAAPVPDGTRCRACGMRLGGTAPTSPFKGGWFWAFAGGLATVYGVTIAAVALAR